MAAFAELDAAVYELLIGGARFRDRRAAPLRHALARIVDPARCLG